jgi:hypothetical protein
MPLRWPNRLRCSRKGRCAAPSVAHRPRAALRHHASNFRKPAVRARGLRTLAAEPELPLRAM